MRQMGGSKRSRAEAEWAIAPSWVSVVRVSRVEGGGMCGNDVALTTFDQTGLCRLVAGCRS